MYCWKCGTENVENNQFCGQCGVNLRQPDFVGVQPPTPQSPSPQPAPSAQGAGSDVLGFIIPKNNHAVIAYYLGIFSIIPCLGALFSIPALILGIKGRQYARQHPEARGKIHAWTGIILGGLSALAHIGIFLLPKLLP